jgi:aryl sulfotransferase
MLAMTQAPTRSFRTALMDSSRWDGYAPRGDDILVATYPKCGTTWTQRIVDLLVFQSPAPRQFFATSPWLDATFFAPVEADLANLQGQTHRRFIKTHLPIDAVPVYEGVKMIHTVRDGRDACISMHNHMLGILPGLGERMAESAGGDPRLMPNNRETPTDPREWYLGWMDAAEAEVVEGFGVDMPFCEFEKTYWARRHEPWLLFVHFNDLKADLVGQMGRISEFLGIDTPPDLLAELATAASFEAMKRQGEELLPQLRHAFDHGAERFINKGSNGRWKDFLTADDLARYDALIARKLSPAMAGWIEHGSRIAGDPRGLPD